MSPCSTTSPWDCSWEALFRRQRRQKRFVQLALELLPRTGNPQGFSSALSVATWSTRNRKDTNSSSTNDIVCSKEPWVTMCNPLWCTNQSRCWLRIDVHKSALWKLFCWATTFSSSRGGRWRVRYLLRYKARCSHSLWTCFPSRLLSAVSTGELTVPGV